jgi:hypothetical protein
MNATPTSTRPSSRSVGPASKGRSLVLIVATAIVAMAVVLLHETAGLAPPIAPVVGLMVLLGASTLGSGMVAAESSWFHGRRTATSRAISGVRRRIDRIATTGQLGPVREKVVGRRTGARA